MIIKRKKSKQKPVAEKFVEPQPKPGESTTKVRINYDAVFAKSLGRKCSGKGRARRIDVKQWASKLLHEAIKTKRDEEIPF